MQCVPEARRAWHAGQSSWAGETDINSCSIGIEIANPGHDHGYPDFPRRQIAAVTALCRSISTRHRIPADRVLGAFRRRALAQERSGREVPLANPAQVRDRALGQAGADRARTAPSMCSATAIRRSRRLQKLLARYGYGIDTERPSRRTPTEASSRPSSAISGPAKVDGVADLSTIETLRALLAAHDATRAKS